MAEKLPDELIKEVLSPILHVPDEKFADASGDSVFFRFHLSTSALLLVCKRWLRVATPLLYEVVVLRSKAQAQALSKVFASNKQLGTFVKKLRVEGGYGLPMEKIIRASPNITDIYLSMAIHSNDSVSGLCRSLDTISPSRLILYDSVWPWERLDNGNTRALASKLFVCIASTWKALDVVHNPYAEESNGKVHLRESAFVSALAECSSLRVVYYSSCPDSESESLGSLSQIPHLQKIQVQVASEDDSEVVFRRYLDETSRLAKIVQFVVPHWASAVIEATSPLALPETDYIPMETASAVIRDQIWTQILSLAMWNDWCDRDFSVADNMLYRGSQIGTTRQGLLTVSRGFYRLGLPLMYAYPVLLGEDRLRAFAAQLAQNPPLGRHIRSIFFHVSFTYGADLLRLLEKSLTTIVTSSQNLKRIHGHRGNYVHWLPMTWDTFVKLSETSASSLITFSGVRVIVERRGLPHPALSPIFNKFKRLRRLEWRPSGESGQSAGTDGTPTTCLSSLESLITRGCKDSFFTHISRLSLPSLTHFECTRHTDFIALLAFVEKHGSKLLDVSVTWPHEHLPILELCPNMTHLELELLDKIPTSKMLNAVELHHHLNRITISSPQHSLSGEKMPTRDREQWIKFFEGVDWRCFPALKEIRVIACEWPTDERSIAKNPWVQLADDLKNEWSIPLTDRTGLPWKSRLKV